MENYEFDPITGEPREKNGMSPDFKRPTGDDMGVPDANAFVPPTQPTPPVQPVQPTPYAQPTQPTPPAPPAPPAPQPPTYTYTERSAYSASTPSYTKISYGSDGTVSGVTPPAPKKEKEKKKLGAVSIIAICTAVSLLIGVSSVFSTYMLLKGKGKSTVISENGTTVETNKNGTTVIYKSVTLKDQNDKELKNQLSVGEVAEMSADSVVEITTEAVATGIFMSQYVTEGAGSGVIITEDGYIVTNHHVIAEATKISVRTRDGKSYTAQLIGSDERTDLAVIKIEPKKKLSYAIYGEYDKCKVGDTVVAIGNPLGELGGTVTDGIISALDRDVTIDGNIMTLMQTNTAINPGNSGGGLFNTSGQLIGVVNAKSSGEGIEGLGFAIPISLAQPVIEDLIEHGYVTGRKTAGFEVLEINDFQTALIYRVTELGLYIYSVDKGSSADKAGIEYGWLIIEANGEEIETEADFKEVFDMLEIGDELKLVLKQGRTEKEFTVVIDEYKPTTDGASGV